VGKVCGIGLESPPAGKIACPTRRFHPFDGGKQRGVTLIEMLVVVMIISVIVAISTPNVSAGIDAVRLATATSSVAAFLNSASTHAERRERPVELVIAAKTLVYISTDPGSKHELNMPDGITMEPISAQQSEDAEGISRWLFMPGGAIPSVAIKLSNQHGGARIVKLDPMTGFPRTERVEAK
jgi:prepilin-type N-terminal cleavage/methylation domain-containing protein